MVATFRYLLGDPGPWIAARDPKDDADLLRSDPGPQVPVPSIGALIDRARVSVPRRGAARAAAVRALCEAAERRWVMGIRDRYRRFPALQRELARLD
jgi:hypothetical protein